MISLFKLIPSRPKSTTSRDQRSWLDSEIERLTQCEHLWAWIMETPEEKHYFSYARSSSEHTSQMSTIDRAEEGIPQQPSYPSPQIHHQKKISFINSNPYPVPGPETRSGSDQQTRLPRRSLATLQYRPNIDGQDGQPGTPVYPYARRPSQYVIHYPADLASHSKKKKGSLRKRHPIFFNILTTIFVMALVSIAAGIGYLLYSRHKK